MADFFELDFLDVETKKSGDAIALRYSIVGKTFIHVVDGGFQVTGDKLVKHIRSHYGAPKVIDCVVLTHNDGDHAGGLCQVFEEFEVKELWMLRPWDFAEELLPRFARFSSVDGLQKRLKEAFPNIAALEEVAVKKKVTIFNPFQGASIGAFRVMSPSKATYLDLVVESEKTPQKAPISQGKNSIASYFAEKAAAVIEFVRSLWGDESFPSDETSAENEMSVVQFAEIAGQKILLTGDVGRRGLEEAADFAPSIGLALPGIDRFQVPHHGSRRNVSTEVLNRWLGTPLPQQPKDGETKFTTIISAAKADEDHPRKAVIRAMIHRGGRVITNQGQDIRTSKNAPKREGWTAVAPLPYPEEQEG
ncbi:MAG: competence protein ComEC [Holophagaceae bacterium]|nr:competence protein ComEC [Holophagaceae bacterium]